MTALMSCARLPQSAPAAALSHPRSAPSALCRLRSWELCAAALWTARRSLKTPLHTALTLQKSTRSTSAR